MRGESQAEETRAVMPTEYVVDRIVDHRVNEDGDHPTAAVGATVYRTRWYGYSPSDDTWEPIEHLPRNKLVSYFKKKRVAIPSNIGEAQEG